MSNTRNAFITHNAQRAPPSLRCTSTKPFIHDIHKCTRKNATHGKIRTMTTLVKPNLLVSFQARGLSVYQNINKILRDYYQLQVLFAFDYATTQERINKGDVLCTDQLLEVATRYMEEYIEWCYGLEPYNLARAVVEFHFKNCNGDVPTLLSKLTDTRTTDDIIENAYAIQMLTDIEAHSVGVIWQE